MNASLDFTHDPARRSWVESANDDVTDFPLQNLPFGAYSSGDELTPLVGVAIGDRVFDLGAALELGLFADEAQVAAAACRAGMLNDLMSLGRPAARALRHRISTLLGTSMRVLVTTRISMPQFITRRTSVRCSDPTIRCSPTTSGCRSAITAGPRRS